MPKLTGTIRSIAVLEFAKGLLVLAAGFGLLTLLHRDLLSIATRMVEHAHLNPASHYPRIFLEAAERTGEPRLRLLAAGAALYASLRLVEGYGLWRQRAWAEWLAALSGALYIPIELLRMAQHPTALGGAVLAVNVVVVAVMGLAVLRRRRSGSPIVAARNVG
ncbi:MAG: DUF2127 domain-containing protein [Burkholderiaceae bacterium]